MLSAGPGTSDFPNFHFESWVRLYEAPGGLQGQNLSPGLEPQGPSLILRAGGEVKELQSVTGLNPMPLREPTVDFHHILRIRPDAELAFRKWLCIGDYSRHCSVSAGEDHIERDFGIFHPERQVLRLLEDEEHPRVVGKMLTIH